MTCLYEIDCYLVISYNLVKTWLVYLLELLTMQLYLSIGIGLNEYLGRPSLPTRTAAA